MQLRPPSRLLALAAGILVLTAPTLTSCGFDYATDRPYTPAAGVNDQDKTVDVLGAVIVSEHANSGTFVATFANNDQGKDQTVDSLSGGASAAGLQVRSFSPIQITPGGMVNLATTGGIVVKGTFSAGDFVPVKVGFGDGQTVELSVPVVWPCGEFTGLDISHEKRGATTSTSPLPAECGPTGDPSQE